jgi:hypothetical protein
VDDIGEAITTRSPSDRPVDTEKRKGLTPGAGYGSDEELEAGGKSD